MTEQVDEIIIRPYAASDWQAVLNVFNSNVPTYFSSDEIDELKNFLDKQSGNYFIAVQGGEIIGAAGFWIIAQQKKARLVFGMVRADYHRKSIGTRLLHHRLVKIKQMNVAEAIEIDTSQKVSGFYEKFGFRITGIEKNSYGPDLDRISMVLEQVTEPRNNGTYL